MEIYKDLKSPENQHFEKLLNSQLSKNKIEEGKIIDGKITKITDKFIFIFIPGLKSEPIIDINELKIIGLQNKISEGENMEEVTISGLRDTAIILASPLKHAHEAGEVGPNPK